MAGIGRGTMPMGGIPATVKLPAEPAMPQEPAVVYVLPPTVTDVTIPWAWAGTIVTMVAANAPEERVPRAVTWSPTQTLPKLADERAASVKVVPVPVTSTVVRRCGKAVATGRARKPPSVKLPAEPSKPQEPPVVLVPTVTDVTHPWARAGTIVTRVDASAPSVVSVPRAVTWVPTQTLPKLADVRAASVKVVPVVTSTVTTLWCLTTSAK